MFAFGETISSGEPIATGLNDSHTLSISRGNRAGRWEGTPNQNSNAVFDIGSLFSGSWDGSAIRLVLTYNFDQSPNIATGKFVDTNLPNRYQASFFANSGVKVENRSEIQIFDTDSLLDIINSTNGVEQIIDGQVETVTGDKNAIDAPGQVSTTKVKLDHGSTAWQVHEADQINALITGIPYAYANLDYTIGETNTERLARAPGGGNQMVIVVSRGPVAGGPYTFTVTVDGHTETYTSIQRAGTTDSNKLYLQSHWGSGVIFTDIQVSALQT